MYTSEFGVTSLLKEHEPSTAHAVHRVTITDIPVKIPVVDERRPAQTDQHGRRANI
jgi:hypothetical protein